jgi:hypothetical protein
MFLCLFCNIVFKKWMLRNHNYDFFCKVRCGQFSGQNSYCCFKCEDRNEPKMT